MAAGGGPFDTMYTNANHDVLAKLGRIIVWLSGTSHGASDHTIQQS